MRLHRILLIGLVTRILLIPFFAHPFDVYAWYKISEHIVNEGPFSVNYNPPMMFYTLIPIAYAYNFVSKTLSINPIPMSSLPRELDLSRIAWGIPIVPGFLFNILVKIPFLISDVAIAIILYKIFKEKKNGDKIAVRAAALWFLNPYLIWISAGWGMFDTLPALFSLISLYMMNKGKIVFSSISLAVGAAYKLFPALFIVPVMFYLRRQRHPKTNGVSARFLTVFIATSIVIFAPTLLDMSNLARLLLVAPEAGLEPIGIGLTYWSIALAIPIDSRLSTLASTSLLAVALLIVFWKSTKLKFENPFVELPAAQLSCILALFLTHRVIPEQFFVWTLPFFILLSIEGLVEERAYRVSSLIALIYSISNLLLPFFMLPMAPWLGESLAQIVRLFATARIRPEDLPGTVFIPRITFGSVYLTVLGTLFSVTMLISLIESLFKPRATILMNILPKQFSFLLRKLKL